LPKKAAQHTHKSTHILDDTKIQKYMQGRQATELQITAKPAISCEAIKRWLKKKYAKWPS